jgi:serine/threonine-protein kinase
MPDVPPIPVGGGLPRLSGDLVAVNGLESAPMSLAPGARVGPYEIVAQIGVGGMGEVYRATDTGLNRDVAIKVLPDEFAQDAQRLARFEREARTLASLNHPGIAILHGLERTSGSRALVMEFIDGPTLADRIAEGPVPVDEALAIAKQIAEALAAAHEQGIVHRDLKPANIKLRADGTVKVLDFGLAKTIEPAGVPTGKSMSPTITSPAMTQAGVILGTAAYMSPEQAKARGADKRSDVWAFGCVLFEMLTGKRPFDGEDVSDTLALVLRGEPDWSALPPTVPAAVSALLRRSLEKDRRRRVADIGAALFVLDEHHALRPTARKAGATWRLPIMLVAAALVAVAALTTAGWWAGARGRPVEPKPVTRLVVPLSGEEQALSAGSNAIALSPDGKHLAFVAGGRLYLRSLDQLEARVLRGTESNPTTPGNTRRPVFSPDSRWIAFIRDREIRKVALAGGPPVTVATAPDAVSFVWDDDGSIVYATRQAIIRVTEGSGTREVLAEGLAGRAQTIQMLPGRRALLLSVMPIGSISPAQAEIVVRTLDTGEQKTVFKGGIEAQYVPTGHLLYFSQGSLLAVPFDIGTFSVHGTPEPVADNVASVSVPGLSNAAANIATSNAGTLAYVSGDSQSGSSRTLVWVDRSGKEELLGLPDHPYVYPRLSPDGRFIAVTMRTPASGDIWVLDIQRKTPRPLTTEASEERYSTWTPDSQRLFFGTSRGDEAAMWSQRSDGSGLPQRVAGFPRTRYGNFVPTSISADGSTLIASATGGVSGSDLWVLQLSSNGEPKPLLQTAATERNGELSPDGRWLAYESFENDRTDVFVRPFPNVNDARWPVSNGGGSQPVWSPDSRELFFLDSANLLTSVTVEDRLPFTIGSPRQVLAKGYVWSVLTYAGRQYDVSRDGKRFLMMKDAGGERQGARHITVVQNWFEELRRR